MDSLQYSTRQLKREGFAGLSPCLRQTSVVAIPASCSLIISMTSVSVKRLFLMSPAPSRWGKLYITASAFAGAGHLGYLGFGNGTPVPRSRFSQ